MKLDQKQQIANELRDRFSKSAIIVVTDYKGLDVAAMNDLRRKLRAEEIEYQVVKNTLLVRASEDNDVALIKDHFKGPSAVALSYDDPVAPAKILSQFAKDNNKLEIKVVWGPNIPQHEIKDINDEFDGFVDTLTEAGASAEDLAIVEQKLAAFNAVPEKFVRTIAEVPRSFVNVLAAIRDQKEAA